MSTHPWMDGYEGSTAAQLSARQRLRRRGLAAFSVYFAEQPDPGDTIPDEPNDPVEEPEPEGDPE